MKLFDWMDSDRWLADIPAYGERTLNNAVLTTLATSRPDGFWSDDLSWFPQNAADFELDRQFAGYYTHIRAYHACRPTDVGSYLQHGLLGQNRTLIESSFRSIFSDVDEALLDRAIDAMDSRGNHENGKIYFSCDPHELVEYCGHYLLQGSEYLMALAARLCEYDPGLEDYRLRLRRTGIPTVFEVGIPVEQIPVPQRHGLMKSIISAWAYHHLAPNEDAGDSMGFVLHSDLGPRNILSHFHPASVPDPHFGRRPVKTETTRCNCCPSNGECGSPVGGRR